MPELERQAPRLTIAVASPATRAGRNGTAPAKAARAVNAQAGSRARVRGAGTFLLSIGLAITAWWLVATFLIADPTLLATPGEVADRAWQLMTAHGGELSLWPNAKASLGRVLIGWGLAAVTGVFVGVVMAGNRFVGGLIDPLVELARPIPPLAYAPLLVVWFGIGESSKIALLWAAGFPVVVITTVAGIKGVDESWRRAALTLGASRLQMIRRVVVPGALPEIVTGLRIASGLCWSSLVAAEIIASTSGLGYMILQASRFLETATILVGIVAIGALAFAMDLALRGLVRWLAPWKGRQ